MLGEVVHIVINPVIIRLILPAVEKDKTSVPHRKRTVGVSVHPAQVIPQVKRVFPARLVISPDKYGGYLVAFYPRRVGKQSAQNIFFHLHIVETVSVKN